MNISQQIKVAYGGPRFHLPDPRDGQNILLQNAGNWMPVNMAQHPKNIESPSTNLRKP